MVSYRPRELILVPMPFVDTPGAKNRPVLILLDTGDDDLVVATVTSQPARTGLDVPIIDWQQTGLKHPSLVRVHKPFTIHKRSVIHALGALTPRDWAQVRARVQQLWASI